MPRQSGQAILIELGIGLALLIGGAIGAKVYWNTSIAEPYRIEGDTRTAKKDKAQMDKLNADLAAAKVATATATSERDQAASNEKACEAGLDNTKASIDRWQKAAVAAQGRSKKLDAELEARIQKDDATAAQLLAIIKGPAQTVNDAINSANKTLTELAAWRRAQ